MWDFLRSRINPVSHALAGGFFTTEPPGKLLDGALRNKYIQTPSIQSRYSRYFSSETSNSLISIFISVNEICIWFLETMMIFSYSTARYRSTICIVLELNTEKAMTPHSSTLAWKFPWMEEPGRLQSMGSLRVGPYWATSLSLFTFMHWRRKWQPTPVCLPGESQGQRSLVGCRLWGRTESDTTEAT